MHKATKNFWKRFHGLPKNIQNLAREKFDLLKKNPHHPSLHLKKVGKFWSIRISLDYRVLGYKEKINHPFIIALKISKKMVNLLRRGMFAQIVR